MGICSSISVKNKKHTHTKSNSIVGGVQKVLLLGYSRQVRDRGEKSHLQSIKLEMEADMEAAVQGYVGMVSTPVQPLWQRRILMGERCEMPRYSGLILYDERGFPLPGSSRAGPTNRVCVFWISFLEIFSKKKKKSIFLLFFLSFYLFIFMGAF